MTTLTPRQKLFIEHYLVTLDGAKAAKLAGYAEKSAHVESHRLRNNPAIKPILEERMKEKANAAGVSPQKVVEELAMMAFARLEKGGPIKGSDKLGALTQLGKHFGMFVDRQEISGSNGGPIEIAKDVSPEQAIESWTKLIQ